ncbi:hypothetical protein H0H93_001435 [Arthromyces matolae]|nr:hypothetical protein H0H93_001435 [Arthromyces matolae]
MKISIINIVFLFIFALAASSTPVPVVQDPTRDSVSGASAESPQSTSSEYFYHISGKDYTVKDADEALDLWDAVLEGKAHPSSPELAAAQRLGIQAILLSHSNDPDLKRNYKAMRLDVHKFMKSLISRVLLPTHRLVNDEHVVSDAKHALETCLQWETAHNYDDLYHINGVSRSLDDEKYLKGLETALIKIIIEEKGDNHKPHTGKRSNMHDGRFYLRLRVQISLTIFQIAR